MILAAVSAFLIDRKFYAAAAWSLAGGLFSFLGLIHAYQVSGNDVDYLFRFALPATNTSLQLPANGIAIGYLLFSVVFLLFGVYGKPSDGASDLSAAD
jgi:AGZA family xanthine/uracil permease-like MFS transporter